MAKKIEILDSTLRDGSQGEGISYSVQDKIHIVQALDELGIKYIEAGNPGSNPKDMEFFQKARELKLSTSKIVAFGSTRRKDIACSEDSNLQSLLSAETEDVVIFGKTWDFQATEILHATLEENLDMIRDTCAYLKKQGRNVIFDAEHFFTGYSANADYAMKALQAAVDGGASVLSLCETKGGCMLDDCARITRAVTERFADKVTVGIHTHNDSGLAVANSLVAVQNGATHVQGVLLGFGERTGNANLVSCVHLAEKGGIDEIHFDVTNGIYVRNISFGPQTVADVQKIASVPVDIHLELDNTLDMIDLYGPLHPGCITVQADSTPHPLMTFRKIHSFGARVGFALNPSISPSQYEYCLPYIDELLIMSVEPGFGGQRFAEHTFKKIDVIVACSRRS